MGGFWSANTSRLSPTLWSFLASCSTSFAGIGHGFLEKPSKDKTWSSWKIKLCKLTLVRGTLERYPPVYLRSRSPFGNSAKRIKQHNPALFTNNYEQNQTSSRFEPDRRDQLNRDPLQLFHFDNQGATCVGFGDHRPLTGENEIEPGF